MTCTITELEHYDNNITEKNRYIKSMRKAVAIRIICFIPVVKKYGVPYCTSPLNPP